MLGTCVIDSHFTRLVRENFRRLSCRRQIFVRTRSESTGKLSRHMSPDLWVYWNFHRIGWTVILLHLFELTVFITLFISILTWIRMIQSYFLFIFEHNTTVRPVFLSAYGNSSTSMLHTAEYICQSLCMWIHGPLGFGAKFSVYAFDFFCSSLVRTHLWHCRNVV